MAALFACTKCHGRHPFEELSQGEQLCKECRNNYPIVKCTYCRSEFQQDNKGNTSAICKKCSHNVKIYGKPTACEYCNVIAAFIGNKCQRCTNSEKKLGSPSTCEQCKQRCAFERTSDSRKKVDGKLLCWLCTQAFKRALAKTRHHQEEAWRGGVGSSINMLDKDSGSSNSSSSLFDKIKGSGNFGDKNKEHGNVFNKAKPYGKSYEKSKEHRKSFEKNKEHGKVFGRSREHWKLFTKSKEHMKMFDKSKEHMILFDKSKDHDSVFDRNKELSNLFDKIKNQKGTKEKESHKGMHKDGGEKLRKEQRIHKSKSHHLNNKAKPEMGSSPKKLKLEKNASNGLSSSKSLSLSMADAAFMDPNSSDHLIAITQLHDQIEAMKKKLQTKDQQLMEKEKKITELKAYQYEADKDFRTKLLNVTKQHSEEVELITNKNRDLMKQVASLSRGKKSTASPCS